MTVSEIILALVLTAFVAGTTVSLLGPAHRALSVHAQNDDLYQRARVGFIALHRALLSAATDAGITNPLGGLLRPAVLPHRWGGHGRFEADALILITMPAIDTRAVTDAPLQGRAGALRIRAGSGCHASRAACGLAAGTTVLIFDDLGRSDLLSVTDVLGDLISVVAMQGRDLPVYPAGSSIIPVVLHGYYFDHARGQVRHHDGWLTDVPVLDNAVALSFQYFGFPYATVRESSGGHSTCPGRSRSSSGRSSPEVELSPSALTDGPWCRHRPLFDVDLFRVHRVRVTLRLQASAAEHRGSDRRLFARPGPAVDYKRFVPDATVRFDVALRNQ